MTQQQATNPNLFLLSVRIATPFLFVIFELIERMGEQKSHEPFSIDQFLSLLLLFFLTEQAVEMIYERAVHGKDDREKQLMRILECTDGIIHELLLSAHTQLSQALEFQTNGFAVDHRDLATSFYVDFLKYLCQEQQKLSAKGRPPLELVALHSGPLYIWLTETPQSQRIYELHKEFTQNGGQITRVLCGSIPITSSEFDKEFKPAAQKMADHGVDVRYYNRNKQTIRNHHWRWDFLWAVSTNQVVIWESATETIEKAVFQQSLSYDKENIPNLWSSISDASEKIPGIQKKTGTSQ